MLFMYRFYYWCLFAIRCLGTQEKQLQSKATNNSVLSLTDCAIHCYLGAE